MLEKIHEYAVFIGRFQPPHLGHIETIKKILEITQNLIIVLGGHRTASTPKNPWTSEERERMMISCFPGFEMYEPSTYYNQLPDGPQQTIHFVGVRDYHYNDNAWIADVQQKVGAITEDSKDIILIGKEKDKSSYYLELFPQWARLSTSTINNYNSTDIRNNLFDGGFHSYTELPESIIDRLIIQKKENPVWHKKLCEEHQYYENYKKQFTGPFPISFITTDIVVVKAGHVLVVRRRVNPGKGLIALPGGFVNPDEWLKDSAFRELKEETRIVINQRLLKEYIRGEKMFDHPERSLRGRTFTYVFYVKLPDGRELPYVRGGDDADRAFWMPLGDLFIREEEFFEDHLSIINYFIKG